MSKQREYLLPATTCPKCTETVTAAANLPDSSPRAPQPGDLTLCGYCAAFLRFDNDLKLHEATREELCDLSARQYSDMQMAAVAIHTYNHKKKTRKNVTVTPSFKD